MLFTHNMPCAASHTLAVQSDPLTRWWWTCKARVIQTSSHTRMFLEWGQLCSREGKCWNACMMNRREGRQSWGPRALRGEGLFLSLPRLAVSANSRNQRTEAITQVTPGDIHCCFSQVAKQSLTKGVIPVSIFGERNLTVVSYSHAQKEGQGSVHCCVSWLSNASLLRKFSQGKPAI